MAVYDDLGAFVLATLQATSAVTDLVMAGAAGVIESGSLDATTLEQQQQARREAATPTKVLAVLVMDTGERADQKIRFSTCSVFVYDRGNPYANIRALREALLVALINQPVVLARDAHIVGLKFESRTGHAISEDFDLDFERVDFHGPLVLSEPDIYS